MVRWGEEEEKWREQGDREEEEDDDDGGGEKRGKSVGSTCSSSGQSEHWVPVQRQG